MPILLDNQPLAVPHHSLAGAIDAARQAAEARGRIVIDVLMDGRRLEGDALQTPSSEPLGQVELSFITTEPGAFVRVALLDAAEELERATTSQQSAAADLRKGDLTSAFGHLSDAVAVWDMVRKAVQDAPTLVGRQAGAMSVTIDGQTTTVAEHYEGLSANLAELKNALSIQDWSTLADVLAHELDEQAAQWRLILTDLAQQLGGVRDGRAGTEGSV